MFSARHTGRCGPAAKTGAGLRRGDAGDNPRTCIVTRKAMARADLARFVLSPDGEVTPDLRCRLPGRGVWVSLSRAAVETAVKKNLFARAFRASCRVGPGLADTLEELLVGDAVAALALANKAGQAVAGFDKVSAALGRGRVAVLIAAVEAAADGADKLAGRARSASGAVERVDCLASAQLGLALGRTNVIHAAVYEGELAKKFLTAARRLETYRHHQERSEVRA